jgi:hypothetical protein
MKVYRAKQTIKAGGQYYQSGAQLPEDIGSALPENLAEVVYMPDPEPEEIKGRVVESDIAEIEKGIIFGGPEYGANAEPLSWNPEDETDKQQPEDDESGAVVDDGTQTVVADPDGQAAATGAAVSNGDESASDATSLTAVDFDPQKLTDMTKRELEDFADKIGLVLLDPKKMRHADMVKAIEEKLAEIAAPLKGDI